jgi:hypothetical protein
MCATLHRAEPGVLRVLCAASSSCCSVATIASTRRAWPAGGARRASTTAAAPSAAPKREPSRERRVRGVHRCTLDLRPDAASICPGEVHRSIASRMAEAGVANTIRGLLQASRTSSWQRVLQPTPSQVSAPADTPGAQKKGPARSLGCVRGCTARQRRDAQCAMFSCSWCMLTPVRCSEMHQHTQGGDGYAPCFYGLRLSGGAALCSEVPRSMGASGSTEVWGGSPCTDVPHTCAHTRVWEPR